MNVKYVVDPNNPYPKAYTGHVRMTLKDGRVFEERQPHIRGGAQEPLTRAEIEDKCRRNCAFGGWGEAQIAAFLKSVPGLLSTHVNLKALRC
jgi:2-methylcitrate dehydratase PrpD